MTYIIAHTQRAATDNSLCDTHVRPAHYDHTALIWHLLPAKLVCSEVLVCSEILLCFDDGAVQAAEAAVLAVSTGPGELLTETVEEFISISDGQVRRSSQAGEQFSDESYPVTALPITYCRRQVLVLSRPQQCTPRCGANPCRATREPGNLRRKSVCRFPAVLCVP